FSGVSKSDKCYLYFDKIDVDKSTTMKELLQNYYINKKTRLDGTFNLIVSGETKNTIYVDLDDDGKTYYFAGNPLDNWIEFGGYYWRIIRINGDGSIRMIYQGTTANATGDGTQTGTSKFNDKRGDNAYVGYMYGVPSSSTYEATHANTNNSTIKEALDNWFNNSNIKQGTSYFNKIDLNTGFCGDREPSSSNTSINNEGGYNTILTYYGARTRLISTNNNVIVPTYKCTNNNDLYTFKSSNKGNKALTYPVGLITADEVYYAGMVYSNQINYNNYLNNGNAYWTMSPYYYDSNGGYASVFVIGGYIGNWYVDVEAGIRPVINLRSDVTFTGDGTISNPYKVV
ncbi:MAG: hypothetical protein NC483_03580, partial [Ruminococcus sp.]|nr:hypothetical protein [Ruminococcus sp.]